MVHRRLPSEFDDAAVSFGRAVRERRERLGWSQDEVLKRADHAINKKTLQRIEAGRTSDDQSPSNPELRVLIELSKVLGGRVVIDYSHPIAFRIEFDHGVER